MRQEKVAELLGRQTLEEHVRQAVGAAEADARVVDGAVRIEQAGADDADARHGGPADQVLEPARLQRLDVVVEVQEERGVGPGGTLVDQPRIVEARRGGGAHDLGVQIRARGQGGEQREGAGLGRVVVHDDNLHAVARGGAGERIEAPGQQVGAVLRRDDDGDVVLAQQRRIPLQLVEAQRVVLHHRRQHGLRAQAAAGDGLGDAAAGGVEEVALLVAARGGALGVGTPVVADVRHVHDRAAIELLDHAEDQVDVLRTGEIRTQAAGRLDEVAAHDGQVVRVIVRDRHLRAPGALELRVEVAAGVVDLVLVGVKHADVGLGPDGRGNVQERVKRQDVVMVEEGDIVPGDGVERGVGRAGDVAVLGAEDGLDARVGQRGRLKHPAHVRLRRGVVGDAQFPVGVKLAADGIEQFAEVFLRRVVGGHDDADPRAGDGERGGVGLQQLGQRRGEAVVPGPAAVGILIAPAGDDRGQRRGRGRLELIGEVRLQAADFAPGEFPVVDLHAAEQRRAEKGQDAEPEGTGAVDRDGPLVLVVAVEVHAPRERQLARAVLELGENLQVDRARHVGADVDQAVEVRGERLGVFRVLGADVGPLLAVDQPVLGRDDRAGR